MTTEQYALLEDYMRACMSDSAHDREHVYRVLYNALKIAGGEADVDYDILIGACLLHDIGRAEQIADPTLCHAEVGAEKARRFLLAHGFGTDYADSVRDCILTHRFRKNRPPQSVEAKILFDADKLDVTGAMGIARTLVYRGTVADPLYTVAPDGTIRDGTDDTEPSFFREYKFKLEKLYDRFYTHEGRALAQQRRRIASDFYESLYREADAGRSEGKAALQAHLTEK